MMCKTSADSKAQMKFCGNHKASVSQILINQTLYGGETGMLFRMIALSRLMWHSLKRCPIQLNSKKIVKSFDSFVMYGVHFPRKIGVAVQGPLVSL